MKWVRAKDGAILGVCKGIARALDLSVAWVRFFWLMSTLFLGAGLGLYLLLAICFPREDKQVEALNPRLLGVCAKIALRTGLEIGIVRFVTICLSLLSFGATIVGYIVLYFVLDDKAQSYNSENRPASPPSTM
jgi:phage shock protein PspC (stress-responsive transcriptional regulator)